VPKRGTIIILSSDEVDNDARHSQVAETESNYISYLMLFVVLIKKFK
jgi:hypothetical protein